MSSYDGKDDDISTTAIKMDTKRVCALSSKGPTPEGRIKPDVVAPGVGILSARSSLIQGTASTSGESPYPDFSFKSGTSMAAPIVSGLAACLRGALRTRATNPINAPSGALIKALLVNGAVDLVGSEYEYVDSGKAKIAEMPAAPNCTQGFGRVSLARSLVSLTADGGLVEGDATRDAVMGPYAVTLPTGDGSDGKKFLRATLAYSDPPAGLTQNELTLRVIGTVKDTGAKEVKSYDPTTKLKFEKDPKSGPVVGFPNVQRATVTDALRFSGIEITVTVTGPIMAWKTRTTQPFAVVWAFDTS